MSIEFKNMKATVGSQDYYAESISISESIDLEYFSALGTKNGGVIATSPPEGSVSINFYVTDASEISNIKNSYGTASFSQVKAGPFTMAKALLSSFSIDGDSTSIIKGAATYNYYGQMSSGSTPSKGDVTITPAHGAASSGQLSSMGVNEFLNFNYSFSQSFDINYSMSGEQPNKVVFNEGSEELSIESVISDVDFEETSLTGSAGLCASNEGFTQRSGEINLYDLCGGHVTDISVSGYLEERSVSSSADSEIIENVTIRQKFVKDEGCQ